MSGQSTATVWYPILGGSIYVTGSSGVLGFYHKDWLGSARLTTDRVNRTVTASQAYAPFGKVYKSSGTWQARFTGDFADLHGALQDTLNRELRTTQGRWISPDPAGLAAVDPANPQTWNRYAYVANNPLNATDPSGLD